MFKKILIGITTVAALVSCDSKQENQLWTLSSPSGTVNVGLSFEAPTGTLSYSLTLNGANEHIQALENSPLGVNRQDISFSRGLEFVSADSLIVIHDTYTMYSGKQISNSSVAHQRSFNFKNSTGERMVLTFRVHNDGAAFRYSFPDQKEKKVVITSEATGFKLPSSARAWLQPYDTVSKWTPGYEKYFIDGIPATTKSPNAGGWCFPALFETNGVWIMLTESDVNEHYFASHLDNDSATSLYRIHLPLEQEAMGMGEATATATLPFQTPWRVVIAARTINTVFESNLMHHVASSQVDKDFSWVKPGRASWSWWSDQNSPQDFNKLTEFVDLAAEMKWEYSLVDANWNEMKNGTLEKLAQYAASKNVGLWAWYNSGGAHNTVSEQPRDIMSDAVRRKEEFKKIAGWGIKGIKVDFFQSDKQLLMEQYMGILKDAADHRLMVNFHGCTIPRGWSRTWPNLLAMESVRGAESYLFAPDFTNQAPKHNVTLAFTRNVIGSMDYTPVTFSNGNNPHNTTYAHEVALPVVFESGILHLADATSQYRKLDARVKTFLSEVPTVWDETRLLDGYPGKYVVVARRKSETWYVGAINGESDGREISIDLKMLQDGLYKASIIGDGKRSESFQFYEQAVERSGKINLSLSGYGGGIVILKKK